MQSFSLSMLMIGPSELFKFNLPCGSVDIVKVPERTLAVNRSDLHLHLHEISPDTTNHADTGLR